MNTTNNQPNNPHHILTTLGIPLEYKNPGNGLLGLYTGKAIHIKPGLTTRDERSVLAHELKHAIDGQTHLPHHIAPKIEAACDLYAADLLINPQELHTLATLYPDDPGRIAYELNVADWVLNAYIRAHPLHLLEDNHAA